jgi:hypothetical protein
VIPSPVSHSLTHGVAQSRRDAAAWRSFSALLTVSHIMQRRPRPRSPNNGLTRVVPDSREQSAIQAGRQTIYESSLRAGQGWREWLYRHQGCFKASDCERLGRQAASHPWSALRVVKSCRKDCPNGRGAARGQSSSSASKTVPELTI